MASGTTEHAASGAGFEAFSLSYVKISWGRFEILRFISRRVSEYGCHSDVVVMLWLLLDMCPGVS